MSQRKLAAIVFTDIVGYTVSMQRNETTAVVMANRHQSVVEERVSLQEGEILNYYGDGSLSIFSSASAAVRCAMEIQEALREDPQVPLRIGIHIGEVFREDGKVFGNGVNIASRIESMGVPGAILLSKEVKDKIRNKPEFELASLGTFEFKNVDEAVHVFAIANKGFVVPDQGQLKYKEETTDRDTANNSSNPANFFGRQVLKILSFIFLGMMLGWFIGKKESAKMPNEAPASRYSIVLPKDGPVALSRHETLLGQRAFDISPDGRTIVYVAEHKGNHQLALRNLHSYQIDYLAGTKDAVYPFFSPDGEWIAFFTSSSLNKINTKGGQLLRICEVISPYGAVWLESGEIVFVELENQLLKISVNESGSEPERIPVRQNEFSLQLMWPAASSRPGHILLSDGSYRIFEVNLASGDLRPLFKGGAAPQYLSSGHLLFSEWGRLMAVALDAKTMEVIGIAQPVVEGMRTESVRNSSQYAVSKTGTLIYASGVSVDKGTFVFVDRQGNEVKSAPLPPDHYGMFRLSDDDQTIIYRLYTGLGQSEDEINVWNYDLQKDMATISHRDISDRGNIYKVHTGNEWLILRKLKNRSDVDTLVVSSHFMSVGHVMKDGKRLAFSEVHPETKWDIWMLDLDTKETRPIANLSANELFGSWSPDEKYIAYQSDESGKYSAIYVKDILTGEKMQISGAGGIEPKWLGHGKEIVYRSGNYQMMSVEVDMSKGLNFGSPRTLWEYPYLNVPGTSYDVTSDGSLFLMKKSVETSHTRNELHIIENWVEELKQRIPVE